MSSTKNFNSKVSNNRTNDKSKLTEDFYIVVKTWDNCSYILDAIHYKLNDLIYKAVPGQGLLEDLPSSGILIRHKFISQETRQRLAAEGQIYFSYLNGTKVEKITGYVFCPLPEEYNLFQRVEMELKCSICLDYVYSGVIISPCEHKFCGACISEWVQKSDTCPNCRRQYSVLRNDADLNSHIETFMEKVFILKRSKEDCKEKDRRDIIQGLFEVKRWQNGVIYKGNLVNNKREGKGIMRFADRTIYIGDWENDKREGYGKLVWTNGDVYVGDWKNDIREGYGKYIRTNGDAYEGEFMDDRRTGKGTMKYHYGDVYEGDFLDNNRTGKGIYIWANGNIYEGDFLNNQRTGKGKYLWTNGDVYEGEFVNDRRTGKGEMTMHNGDVYEGGFVDDRIATIEKYTWANRNICKEEFIYFVVYESLLLIKYLLRVFV